MTNDNITAIVGLGAAGVMIFAPLIFSEGTAKQQESMNAGSGGIPFSLPASGTERAASPTVNIEAPERSGTEFFAQAAAQPTVQESSKSSSSGGSSGGSFTLSSRQKKSLESKNVDTDSFERVARETQSTPDPFIRDDAGNPIGSRDIANRGDAPVMSKKPEQNMTPLPDTKKKSERNMTPLPEPEEEDDNGLFGGGVFSGIGGLF